MLTIKLLEHAVDGAGAAAAAHADVELVGVSIGDLGHCDCCDVCLVYVAGFAAG